MNVLIALLERTHIHHDAASRWFETPRLHWVLCPFTEAGTLRYFTQPTTGRLSIREATAVLTGLKQVPGFRYQPITADWHTLARPIATRLHGYRQITDAFLLGLAIHENLILATFDSALVHLAGDYRKHVHLLKAI